jgi:hypothetical protein
MHKDLFFLFLISILAITGLVLMINLGTTGLVYGGGLGQNAGRAVYVGTNSPTTMGNPEGIPITWQTGKGYVQGMGMNPCPSGYRKKNINIARQDPACVTPAEPDYYYDILCCPSGSSLVV